MFQQLLYVALTVLIIGLTLYLLRRMIAFISTHRHSRLWVRARSRYVLLENSRKQDAKLRKRLRSGGAS